MKDMGAATLDSKIQYLLMKINFINRHFSTQFPSTAAGYRFDNADF